MSNLGLRLASSKASRVSTITCLKSCWGARNLHQPRGLLYPIDQGLGEFLPPAALKTVAVDYQNGLLERLNDEVRDTDEKNMSVAQTLISTAALPEKTLAFNYGSLALNNSFFLDHLKPPPQEPATNHQAEISSHLANAIREQHGSMRQLKSSFSSAAMGLFTSGWVWFVTDKNGNTGVIPTFGPGTLLIRSRSYMAHAKGLILGENLAQIDRGDPYYPKPGEEYDPSDRYVDDPGFQKRPAPRSPTAYPSPPGVNPSSPATGVSGSNTPTTPNQLRPRFLHDSARVSMDLPASPVGLWDGKDPEAHNRALPQTKVDMLNIGEVLYPLFCVSVYEHTWMSAGYGVWGKEEWLKKFWTVLDWGKISKTYGDIYSDKSKF